MLDPVPILALDDCSDDPVNPEPRVRLALAQLCLGLAIFAVCLGMPRAGGAVLLIPVVPHSVATLIHYAEGHGIKVLRSGWIAGSVLVRIDGEVPIIALLRAGVMPVGAPALLCSTRPLASK